MFGFIQKLFDQNDREVKRLESNEVVARVNALEAETKALPDLADGLPPSAPAPPRGGRVARRADAREFALTREAGKRFLGCATTTSS
jgi:preprotein translocase subunit SecA